MNQKETSKFEFFPLAYHNEQRIICRHKRHFYLKREKTLTDSNLEGSEAFQRITFLSLCKLLLFFSSAISSNHSAKLEHLSSSLNVLFSSQFFIISTEQRNRMGVFHLLLCHFLRYFGREISCAMFKLQTIEVILSYLFI